MTKKIAIIGEVCTDQYVFGQCNRVCPEAAALCFNHNNDTIVNSQGMAGNVYKNLRSLNTDFKFEISLISPPSQIIKKRFIDSRYNTIIFREDINDKTERIDLHNYNFSQYDCIVFSDYCKGFLSESDIIDICKMKAAHCITFLDSKKILSRLSEYIDIIKINNHEFKQNIIHLPSITDNTMLIVTEGDNGAKLYNNKNIQHYPTEKVLLRDVCGAGDTFLAALVARYLESKNIDNAISFANLCSSKVVAQFGVVSI
jgi:D-beta-D-heptose 7-phosphate kinase/D-beta-D-heptose 1-phosphate adenosyltransferase